MNVRLADPARSRIVLIGTPSHRHTDERLPDVPVVANNVSDLAAVFTDPELGGFDTLNCVSAAPDAGMADIGELLTDAAESAKDLLLIYYAGHGLLDRRGQLHLALADTHPDRLGFTALPYETLRAVCLDSAAKSRVVILDSCYSGRAIGSTLAGGAEQEILGELEVSGTYTLTSAPANRTALILPGERHTAFTGRLVQLLRDGDPELGEVLSMGEIYKHLHARLKTDGLPEPQQRGTDMADLLGLVRNRRPAAPPVAMLPDEIREGLDSRFADFRLAAVKWLGEWMSGSDAARERAAILALREVAENDNPKVAGAARTLLDENGVHDALISDPAELLTAQKMLMAVAVSKGPLSEQRKPEATAVSEPEDPERTDNAAALEQARRAASEAERAVMPTLDTGHLATPVLVDVARAWATVDRHEAKRVAAEVELRAAALNGQDYLLGMADAARAFEAAGASRRARQIAEKVERRATDVRIPQELPDALVAAARAWSAVEPIKAERLARSIALTDCGDKALAFLADEWAARSASEAERVAMSIVLNERRVGALSAAARAWAGVDPVKAQNVAREAVIAANAVTDGPRKVTALSEVARAWAPVHPNRARAAIEAAERAARTLYTGEVRSFLLSNVTRGWAAVDPATARQVANTIAHPGARAEALMEAAIGWAAVDPVTAEQIADHIEQPTYRARALAEIARAWAK